MSILVISALSAQSPGVINCIVLYCIATTEILPIVIVIRIVYIISNTGGSETLLGFESPTAQVGPKLEPDLKGSLIYHGSTRI
jgi:hypothetical protein